MNTVEGNAVPGKAALAGQGLAGTLGNSGFWAGAEHLGQESGREDAVALRYALETLDVDDVSGVADFLLCCFPAEVGCFSGRQLEEAAKAFAAAFERNTVLAGGL